MNYIYIFFIAFISATILPLGSEAAVIYYTDITSHPIYIWSIATLGNSLGSLLNYYIGYKGESYLESKKYLNKTQILKYKQLFIKYGFIAVLSSWIPIIGDPLTLIAGALRYNLKLFISLIFIAKGGRYAVVLYLFI